MNEADIYAHAWRQYPTCIVPKVFGEFPFSIHLNDSLKAPLLTPLGSLQEGIDVFTRSFDVVYELSCSQTGFCAAARSQSIKLIEKSRDFPEAASLKIKVKTKGAV